MIIASIEDYSDNYRSRQIAIYCTEPEVEHWIYVALLSMNF